MFIAHFFLPNDMFWLPSETAAYASRIEPLFLLPDERPILFPDLPTDFYAPIDFLPSSGPDL